MIAHTTTPPGQHLVVGDNSHYPTSGKNENVQILTKPYVK